MFSSNVTQGQATICLALKWCNSCHVCPALPCIITFVCPALPFIITFLCPALTCIITFYLLSFCRFTAHLECTVLQCDLPPLGPHCGNSPGRDLNPGRAIFRGKDSNHQTPMPPTFYLLHLFRNANIHLSVKISLKNL